MTRLNGGINMQTWRVLGEIYLKWHIVFVSQRLATDWRQAPDADVNESKASSTIFDWLQRDHKSRDKVLVDNTRTFGIWLVKMSQHYSHYYGRER